MNGVKHHLCVFFGLVLLFSLSVTVVNAGSPEKRGVAGGILEETKAFNSGFVPAGHADSGVSEGVHAPEPATMVLLGTGLLGLAIFGRKKLKK